MSSTWWVVSLSNISFCPLRRESKMAQTWRLLTSLQGSLAASCTVFSPRHLTEAYGYRSSASTFIVFLTNLDKFWAPKVEESGKVSIHSCNGRSKFCAGHLHPMYINSPHSHNLWNNDLPLLDMKQGHPKLVKSSFIKIVVQGPPRLSIFSNWSARSAFR